MQPFETKSFSLVVALYLCELVNDVETLNEPVHAKRYTLA